MPASSLRWNRKGLTSRQPSGRLDRSIRKDNVPSCSGPSGLRLGYLRCVCWEYKRHWRRRSPRHGHVSAIARPKLHTSRHNPAVCIMEPGQARQATTGGDAEETRKGALLRRNLTGHQILQLVLLWAHPARVRILGIWF